MTNDTLKYSLKAMIKEIENFFIRGPSVNALTNMFWNLTDPSGDYEKSLDYIGIR